MLDRDFILEKLSRYPIFFQTFLDYSTFEETDTIPTAGVAFDRFSYEPIVIKVNPKFWAGLDDTSKIFVVCHELLHILLRHGQKIYKKDIKVYLMNKAMDIVINHSLTDYYGFIYEDLNGFLRNEGCWIKTCFPTRTDILKDQTSEYYYKELLKNKDGNTGADGFDEHEIMSQEDAEALKDFLETSGILEDFAWSKDSDKIYENLTSESTRSAIGEGNFFQLVKRQIPIKRKWESVVKKWESVVLKENISMPEVWDRTSRRLTEVMKNPKVKLPTTITRLTLEPCEDVIDVCFFLDASGSCIDFKDRFYAAAKSLNPKRFNVKLFSFDTKVQELNLNDFKVYGGGGTSFTIIENKIQEMLKTEHLKKYPWVWVITDGDGDFVNPEISERWNIFLTDGSTNMRCFPKDVKSFQLKDYE